VSEASCEAVRDALLAGRSGTDPALEAHAEQCDQCATLLLDQALLGRALGGAAPMPGTAGELWPNLQQAMQRETGPRAWLRSRSTRVRVVLALAVLMVVVLLGAVRLRHDWSSLPTAAVSAWLGAFIATGLGAIALALPDLGRAKAPRAGRSPWLWLALSLPAAYALSAWYTLEHIPLTPAGPLLAPALSCFSYGILLSAPLLALFWALDRGAGPRSRVLAAAAATGLAANGALLLHCPSVDEAHLFTGHAAIGFALACVAWFAASRERASRKA
jgi:hypothetical protein